MKPGDLVEWRDWGGNPKYTKRGIIIRRSNIFGWLVYFPTQKNKFDHFAESAIKKIQQPTKEK